MTHPVGAKGRAQSPVGGGSSDLQVGAGVGEDRRELESNSQPLAATLGPLLSSPFLTEPLVSCFPGTMTSAFIPHKAGLTPALDGTFVGQVPPPSTSHPTVGA